MKLAICGKGGVGKTTIAAILAKLFAQAGYKVLAIDADSNPNLAAALGFRHPEKITPLTELNELITERTGAAPGAVGTFFKLNPRVDDLPDKFGLQQNNIKLMVMGTVKGAGLGCVCPANAFLKALLQHILLKRDEMVILDMEAGVEHLGRGTAQAVDALIIVTEPTPVSLETAHRIAQLAHDIGIKNRFLVGNKVYDKTDKEFISANAKGLELMGFLSYNDKIREAERQKRAWLDIDPQLVKEINRIKQNIELRVKTQRK